MISLRTSEIATPRWRHVANSAAALTARSALARLPLKGLAQGGAELRDKVLLLFGLGAVGGQMLQQLVRMGVRKVIACDPDVYDFDSAATQPCDWADAGRPKALVQFEQAQGANPAVELDFFQCELQELPLAALRQADCLVAAPDNAEAVVHAGRMAAAFCKPLVQAAVDPFSWSAIVRGYDLRDPHAACPACAMPKAEWNRMTSRIGCDPATARRQGGESTRSLAPVTSAAGSLGVAEVIKRLAGRDEQALNGEEFLISLQSHRGMRTKFDRNPLCRCPHERWLHVDEPRAPRDTTFESLALQLGMSGPEGLLQVRSESPWISWTGCGECGRRVAVQRFARLGLPLGACECGADLSAGPSGWRSVLPAADLRDCWDRSLDELGIEPGQAVGFAREAEWKYVFFAGEGTVEK